MKRGDVVIVEFPYIDGRKGKNRPALVVQNDRDNKRLATTIIAMISGNTRRSTEPTQLLVDPSIAEGRSSGLHGVSVVKCNNLFTIAQKDVLKHIGVLSVDLMLKVDECLKDSLGLV